MTGNNGKNFAESRPSDPSKPSGNLAFSIPSTSSTAMSDSATKGQSLPQISEEVPTEEDDEDNTEYPGPIPLALITIALALAVFLTALDNMIIATAIPFITTQFNSLDDVAWYGAAYLITTGGFQLMFGKFYILFPIKWVFLISISIFEVGSLLCGAAPNSTALIIGRAIAGLGSAGLFSGAMVIVSYAVRLDLRPIYFGIFGAVYAVASVVGPLLGGIFTDRLSWRWCFYINLPVGAVTIVVIIAILKHPNQEDMSDLPWQERLTRLDLPGNALFMAFVICLLLAIQWGGVKFHWQNARIIILLILALAFAIIFAGLQIKLGEKATVPPRIIRNRSIYVSFLFSFFLLAAMFYTLYYLPIWFQAVQGVSAVQSGVRSLPLILSMTVASFIAGAVVTYSGYYVPAMIFGCCLVAVGEGLLVTLKPDSSSAKWIGYQVVVGFGIGASNQQPLIAVQNVLSKKDIPTGTALMILAQTLGGAVGVTVGQSIFGNELKKNIRAFAPGIDVDYVISLGASHIKDDLEPQYIDGVKLSYNNAIATAFYAGIAFAGISAFGSLGMEWKSVRRSKDIKGRRGETDPHLDHVNQTHAGEFVELPEIPRVTEVVDTDREEKKSC